MINIRPATSEDLPAITEIYNEAILKTVATFDTEPKSLDQQAEWFDGHDDKHPIIVAELESRVAGWAHLSEWSGRCAYSDTAEISLYVYEAHQGRGVGRRLMEAIIEAGRAAGLHTLIARIAEGNAISVHLHELFGFEHVGVMIEVGRKFDRLLDVYLMQKIFD